MSNPPSCFVSALACFYTVHDVHLVNACLAYIVNVNCCVLVQRADEELIRMAKSIMETPWTPMESTESMIQCQSISKRVDSGMLKDAPTAA